MGSIPARAEQTLPPSLLNANHQGLSRSRGGTAIMASGVMYAYGLSPLARGNHVRVNGDCLILGPIPARAGEPNSGVGCTALAGAYPRSRGGTSVSLRSSFCATGLSPLARGNRWRRQCRCSAYGPIPARAGEPAQVDKAHECIWAYPRSRGGTRTSPDESSPPGGLSPLARGNPLQATQAQRLLGPIPARAGEP